LIGKENNPLKMEIPFRTLKLRPITLVNDLVHDDSQIFYRPSKVLEEEKTLFNYNNLTNCK